jgi:hypothetical protein
MISRTAPLPVITQTRLAPALVAVGEAAAAWLRESGVALVSRQCARGHGPAAAAFDGYVAEMTAFSQDSATGDLPLAARERIFALAFALEKLRQDLSDLDRCISDFCEAAGRRLSGDQARIRPGISSAPERKQPARGWLLGSRK